MQRIHDMKDWLSTHTNRVTRLKPTTWKPRHRRGRYRASALAR